MMRCRKTSGADALHVLRSDIAAAIEESVSARGQRQINRRSRRGTVTDQAFQLQIVCRWFARRPDDVDNVILDAIVDINAVHDLARRDDVLRVNHRHLLQVGRGRRHQIQNLSLLGFLRIADVQFQHEAVELRFRQLIRALLLERILRRQDKERIGEGISCFANRDLPFLHRFEQRALNLGRGAIDFVRQNQVGKDGPSFVVNSPVRGL